NEARSRRSRTPERGIRAIARAQSTAATRRESEGAARRAAGGSAAVRDGNRANHSGIAFALNPRLGQRDGPLAGATMKAKTTLLLLILAGCSAGGGGIKRGAGTGPQGTAGGSSEGDTIFKPGTVGSDPDSMGVTISETCPADCQDFPAAPIMDPDSNPAPPANAASLFGAPDNVGTSGACVREPSLADDGGKSPAA